jgi:hypothetical protein
MPQLTRQKITFGEMRSSGVPGLVAGCALLGPAFLIRQIDPRRPGKPEGGRTSYDKVSGGHLEKQSINQNGAPPRIIDGLIASRVDDLTVDKAGAVGLPVCGHLIHGRLLGVILPLGL